MRSISEAEMLALTKAIEMETNALAVGQASMMGVADEQLKKLMQTGIDSTKARIMGLQQFLAENPVISQSNAERYTTIQKEV